MQILEIVLWFIVAICICMVAAKFMATLADSFFRANDEKYREERSSGGSPPWWPLWWWGLWQDIGLLVFAAILILIVWYLI